ncbi:MAG: ABC transporter permease [Alphaproteobacteria bacterium]|nr:ABC transporter permease [Alphaproteobacteria bacterium]
MTLLLTRLRRRLLELAVLLGFITTLLFFLLRFAGDPATLIAGENASPEELAELRAHLGMDRSMIVQFLAYAGAVLRLDFGRSLAADLPALGLVAERLGDTMLLAVLAIVLTAAIAVPLGTWLVARPGRGTRPLIAGGVFVAQGIPGYIAGLLFIQLFAVELGWLPSIGREAPFAWVLPTATLAAFLAPKLTRVVAANVAEAMREDYIRTAAALGASDAAILWRHALPNALLGATALLGTQFAFLLAGALTTEVIFAWPGLGRLLVTSVQVLDFPVVQATVFVVAILVFAVNALTDVLVTLLDPRLRGAVS